MGKRGPQKKPDQIKRLEGNPGKRRLNDGAPIADGAAACPDHISGYAEDVWHRVTSSMPPQLYGAADQEILAAYCKASALHRDAILALEREGAVVSGQSGAPYQNPWISILNRQAQLIATLGSRLGLDPAARSSLTLPEKPTESKFADLVAIRGGRKGS